MEKCVYLDLYIVVFGFPFNSELNYHDYSAGYTQITFLK